MPNLMTYFAAATMTIFFVVTSWIVVDLLGLTGTTATIVRVVLIALGMSVGGIFAWWRYKKAKEKKSEELPTEQDELGPLFRDAQQRLASSQLGREGRISMLPAVLVLGESGSAKTSVVINAGVDAELLGGHVYQDGYIMPTRSLNLWFARNAVVAEAGGPLITVASKWIELLKKLKPAQLRQVFGRGRQAPRAAVVCVDAEGFLQHGSQEAMTQLARRLNARLGEVCRTLGIQLPVYVLFTRCDRIPFFMDFVANLTDEEARQVVGATLPMALNQRIGTYAEEETRRLTWAFHELFLGLADHRPPLLKREHHTERLPGVYEFPREFRKLRTNLVQFLVDLCRPSQLQTSPYLRGFYFSGVRPVEVREVVRTARPDQQAASRSAEATGIFSLGAASAQPQQQASVQVRRVPQWVFVQRLFNEVILADQTAFRASSMSVGTNVGRRLLMSGAAVLALMIATGFMVSFFKNRALQKEVSEAVASIGAAGPVGQELAPVDTLRRLDTLRASVERLTVWNREGAPWSMRWGLYTGNSLLPTARRLYFSRFHQVMFGTTQEGLVAWCRKLPASPGPDDDYGYTYDTLKGYLITTSHPDKSTKMFLSPLLVNRWAGDRKVDEERLKLAQAQFDFYSEELKHGNMFSSENDSAAIERARRYLGQFAGVEPMYQFMLAEAGRKHPAVNFNKMFPGSAQVVVNNKDIAGAFTKEGYAFMIEAIKNFEKFFAGEEWVLGPRTSGGLDRSKIEPELMARYRTDFLGNWREYLRSSVVVRYTSVQDAAKKLAMMANNASFLMGLMCVASENTAAAELEELKAPFQPVQHVTPPGCKDQYISQNNQPYMNGLMGLQTALESVRSQDPNDPAVGMTLQSASQAKMAARQLAQGFRIDKEGQVERMTQKLLEDPITYVEGLLGRLAPQQVNAGAGQMCADFAQLMRKYPFDPKSQVDATISDVNAVLQPGSGSFWAFYESTLKQHLIRQGPRFVPNPSSQGLRITPQFLGFFNRAVAFSDALYGGGSQQEPTFVYTLRTLPMDVIASLTLSIDGTVLKSTGKGGAQASFTWPGKGQQTARLSATPGGRETDWLQFSGLWGAFRLFEDADRWQRAGNGFTFEVTQRSGQSGQPVTVDGKPVTVRFALEMGTTEPIFQKGYLSGLRCVSQAAQ
ncbi:MAG: hypothetical protein KJZ84_18670 [Bryobacteraceae bacterium]|nr:hypothetical protein [Bryobacteraceae bacterium]